MKKKYLDSFAALLRQQRRRFMREFRRAEQALDTLAEERESELEEHAQEEQSARFLTRLDDHTLRAVQQIDAALQKILDGTYGECEGCRRPIAAARLRSLPAARFCRRCAARQELQAAAVPAAAEAPQAPLPTDLDVLTDEERTEAIRSYLKEDGRIDLDELHAVCRKGVVYLSGKLPSDAERQILLHTLTDVLGFKEIVDHLEVDELLWETERRARESALQAPQLWEDSSSTDDIVESAEEGTDFVAPEKPMPDEQ